MKTLISAIALLVSSNFAAMAADQTLKVKLAAFNVGEKDGEYHFVGATVSPDGTIGTKDFFVKEDQNGKGAARSTYYFPAGSIVTSDSFVDTATQTGGHVVGKLQIVSGTGAYQGATGTGAFEGDWGDKSPLKNAMLLNIEMDVKTPGT
jgi:ABC-type branched-subunit amino acid transport system substrate-binding protein